MISVMEGDKQVAGIPVKIVKSTMSKIQSKQDDVGIVILEDLSEITKMLEYEKNTERLLLVSCSFCFTALIYIRFIIWLKLYKSRYFISKK